MRSCWGSSRCGQQHSTSTICHRPCSAHQFRHGLPQMRSYGIYLVHLSNSSWQQQQRQQQLVRSSNGMTTQTAPTAVSQASENLSNDLNNHRQWEEEIEETLKLVRLLPPSGVALYQPSLISSDVQHSLLVPVAAATIAKQKARHLRGM